VRLSHKVLYACVIILVLLLVVELGLHLLISPQRLDRKVWLEIARGTMVCFSSEPTGPYSLDLRDPRGRARAAALVRRITGVEDQNGLNDRPTLTLSDLARLAPYCVVHHADRRNRGFFPRRSVQVALLGDSSTYGEGVTGKGTLGYLLGLRYPKINFRTYDPPGADVRLLSEILSSLLARQRRPRAVVYFYNLNDALRAPDLRFSITPRADPDVMPGRELLDPVLGWSALYQLVRKTVVSRDRARRVVQGYREMYLGDANRAGVEHTFDIIAAMARGAGERGVTFHLVVFPILFRGLDGRYPFAAIHARIMAACAARKLDCVDGYPAFAGQKLLSKLRVHRADSHPNARANQILTSYLARSGKLPLP